MSDPPRAPEGGTAAGAADPARADMRFCARCRELAPTNENGECTRCRSLVGAHTIPFAVSQSMLRRSGRFVLESDADLDMPLADPLIGVVVADRYRIVELLGRGGMGIVYKVEHVRIGKLLAMKLLTGELSRNAEVVRRFKHEALTASKLSSPNTVQVFDYGVSDGLTYLVMELVTGHDLGHLLKVEGPLPAARVGRVVVQIASSLAEAHGHGIVHRDIKPENVMILRGRDGSDLVKVLDFGLAKLRESSELNELTSQGAIVGTPYFMSPEQVRGDPVDARADVYSLGAVMYRALTGQVPFQGPSPMSVFAKHLTETPRPPHEVLDAVPRGMSDVVVRALAKDPADRYARIEDLQSAVMAVLTELGHSGVDRLLDSGALRDLAPPAPARDAGEGPIAIATRDEVEAYERKLRRQRVMGTAIGLLVPIAALGLGAHYLLTREVPVVFQGTELEPNDTPATANELPFGQRITALLGRRLSPTQSDVDFYAVEVPEPRMRLALRALPNIPLCVQIFERGQVRPTAQLCSGSPGVDLDAPALELGAGSYLFAVLQDTEGRGDRVSPIHENVSDRYELTVGAAEDGDAFEVEPNDALSGATPLASGTSREGTLGWVRDADVFCPAVDHPGPFRFRIEDEPREGGAILSAALVDANGERAPVRIHPGKLAQPSDTDQKSPFVGFRFEGPEPPCVVLRAVVDPGQTGRADPIPRASRARYRIGVEPSP